MPTETGFDIDWLKERFQFDVAARNRQVGKACFDAIKTTGRLRVADIGSGTGSNCIYMLDRTPKDQEWTFVELNPILLEASFERVAAYAIQRGYKMVRNPGTLQLTRQHKTITVRGVNCSFLELAANVDLDSIDLITAGAVFDLLSEEMFLNLARVLIRQRIALLATLNYSGMTFKPNRPLDEKYIQLYNKHMVRKQPFGEAMGPRCIEKMLQFYRRQRVSIITGESNWEVEPDDDKMQTYLLNFMENACVEMISDYAERVLFNKWIKEKREMVRENIMHTTVFHDDLFVWRVR